MKVTERLERWTDSWKLRKCVCFILSKKKKKKTKCILRRSISNPNMRSVERKKELVPSWPLTFHSLFFLSSHSPSWHRCKLLCESCSSQCHEVILPLGAYVQLPKEKFISKNVALHFSQFKPWVMSTFRIPLTCTKETKKMLSLA